MFNIIKYIENGGFKLESIEDDNRRDQIAKNLGRNLLNLRKARGYTREELAEKSNLSANYIYGLENGTYLPGCLALIDLSNALNTTTTDLLNNYIDNKKNVFLEKISQNIDKLSDRDLDLILSIVEFCNKN